MYFVTPASLVYPSAFNESDEEAALGPHLQEEKYAAGLTVLLTLIFLGMAVSVLMCIATRREPSLWMTVFEGIMSKNRSSRGQVVKLPQRVRFQLPDNHINIGFSKTLLLSPTKDNENEDEDQAQEEGTVTICS